MEGADFAKANGCDVVVAIGGGSIMDCAKAIAFLSINDGDINDYIYNRLQSDKALPLILIPTTCGTGSEMALQFLQIRKMEIRNLYVVMQSLQKYPLLIQNA